MKIRRPGIRCSEMACFSFCLRQVLFDEGGGVFHFETGSVDFFERPVPPADFLEGFADGLGEAPADEACRIATDDGVGRDVFHDVAI